MSFPCSSFLCAQLLLGNADVLLDAIDQLSETVELYLGPYESEQSHMELLPIEVLVIAAQDVHFNLHTPVAVQNAGPCLTESRTAAWSLQLQAHVRKESEQS